MKKVKVNLTANVKDDFEPGDCNSCPFAGHSSYEDAMRHYHEETYCKLGFSRKVCPIEETTKKDE